MTASNDSDGITEGNAGNQPQGPIDLNADDYTGLAAGLAGLAGLVAGAATLENLLTEVATFAMLAVPGADGAGVTMLELGEPDVIVASDTFVEDVDAIQYRLGEGPCISAAATGETTMSPALGEDAAWPRFGRQAAGLGVHSALSLPLVMDGSVLGALNVYAHVRDAFSESSRRLGQQFARAAAVAMHNARTLEKSQQTALRLEAAMTNRSSSESPARGVDATDGDQRHSTGTGSIADAAPLGPSETPAL